MNILILSWRGPRHPDAGGAEYATFEHAKGWVKKGHNVTIFTSYFKNAKNEENINGVKVKRFGDQYFGVKILAFFWYIFGKHPSFDLVIDEFHGIPFFTPLYVKVKKLAFIHEVAKEVWVLNPWPKPFNLIPSFFGRLLEPWIFRIFYRRIPFMTVSNSTKDDLVRWGIPSKNITVVHNGVEVIKFKTQPSKEKRKTVIYLGTISRDKGIFDAVRAFAEMERKDDTWRYWIAGKATRKDLLELKKLIRNLGLSKKLKYWGWVGEKKKFELLAKASVLVNPSYHEGWGLVNIEANSVGTPVVGYKVHGLKDSVKDGKTGILVEKGDYKNLAQEILALVNDKEKYEKIRQNAIKWSKKFTWEKAVKKSLELIESL